MNTPLRIATATLALGMAACSNAPNGGTPPPSGATGSAGATASAATASTPVAADTKGERTPAAPEALLGTHWHLVGADGGALAALAADSRITLEFGADCVSGSGGCNQYAADYTQQGDLLTVGAIGATKRGCPGPEGQAEQAWFAALSQPLKVARVAEELHLDGGGALLRLRPGEPPPR